MRKELMQVKTQMNLAGDAYAIAFKSIHIDSVKANGLVPVDWYNSVQ